MNQRTILRLGILAVLGGATATALVACVSDDSGSPLAPSVDASFQFDANLPRFDASALNDANLPSVDSSPGADTSVPPADGSSPVDSTVPPTDASDAAAPVDATVEDAAIVDAAVTYTDALAATNWTPFNAASLDAGLYNFGGVTFDGRYAYFAPYHGQTAYAGVVSRLDTTQDYSSPASWTTYESTLAVTGAGAFGGAVFDGRYVYFVPVSNSLSKIPNSYDQTFVRYDTQGAGFTAPGSWEQFDGSSLVSGPFVGGSFDGRYVYFAPSGYSSVAIYDTSLPFTAQGSWSTFDTSTLDPPEPSSGTNFAGSIFDGTYTYFIANVIARHDTRADAGAGAASWATYLPERPNDAGTYSGYMGAFDGRYLYVLNHNDDVVVRYDTTLTFNAPGSWAPFDVSTAGAPVEGFFGANFDGRYLYFFPENGTAIAIYDTTLPYNAPGSWTTFDTKQVPNVQASPQGYEGSLFDGQNLYVVSANNTQMLRLKVKTGPGPLPTLPEWHGSFY